MINRKLYLTLLTTSLVSASALSSSYASGANQLTASDLEDRSAHNTPVTTNIPGFQGVILGSAQPVPSESGRSKVTARTMRSMAQSAKFTTVPTAHDFLDNPDNWSSMLSKLATACNTIEGSVQATESILQKETRKKHALENQLEKLRTAEDILEKPEKTRKELLPLDGKVTQEKYLEIARNYGKWRTYAEALEKPLRDTKAAIRKLEAELDAKEIAEEDAKDQRAFDEKSADLTSAQYNDAIARFNKARARTGAKQETYYAPTSPAIVGYKKGLSRRLDQLLKAPDQDKALGEKFNQQILAAKGLQDKRNTKIKELTLSDLEQLPILPRDGEGGSNSTVKIGKPQQQQQQGNNKKCPC